MTPCPDGSWTTDRGASQENDCIPCPRGYFCKFSTMFADKSTNGFESFRNTADNYKDFLINDPNDFSTYDAYDVFATFVSLSDYWGKCSDGYICEEGATSRTPADLANDGGYPCEAGYYCLSGDVIQRPCEPGTYNPSPQAGVCLQCEPGKYCNDFAMTDGLDCPNAYFCSGY